ncbi:MAG: HAD-IIIA family hydrolase [Candidatus Omnitrophica bacterium]|nr:HAD-IIIA family hydrolase [Candidatus Omnitrophota bacterium]
MIEKIKKIQLLILDVDGVLTNGKIIFNDQGKEIKVFDVQDGFGIVLFRKAGYKVAILSARSAPAVKMRARDLKIDKVCQDAYPKIKAYKKLLKEFKLKDEQVCFMGDDLTDLEVLGRVGFAVAVSNAVVEVKRAADYITKEKGGEGAIREVIELILKTQGRWRKIVQSFS